MNFILKKLVFILFLTLTLSSNYAGQCRVGVECSDIYSSLIFDYNNGNIISEVRSMQTIYPASLVKLMTVYIAFEEIKKNKLRFNQKLTISSRGEEVSNINKINTLKLKKGDQVSVKQAIRGTIIKSFNEASVTLAEAISGNEWQFAKLMNKKARELGMFDTSFKNSTGLHHQGQYTTAFDLARLVKALKSNFPQYYYLFSQEKFKYKDKKFTTHNNVLLDYPGAEGLKTGFTRASGFNLISIAKRNKNRLVSILANCSSHELRDEQTIDAFNQSFNIINSSKISYKKNKISHQIDNKFNYNKISKKQIDLNSKNYVMRFGGGI